MKMRFRLAVLLALLPVLTGLTAATAGAAKPAERFESHVFKNRAGKTMPYRLLAPANYDKAKKYPLVLFLHGAGERGADNEKQLRYFVTFFASEDTRKKYPCFVLAPQCPADDMWVDTEWNTPKVTQHAKPTPSLALAMEVLDAVEKNYSVDSDRLYVAGISMGGFGTWDLITRHPKRFAAAMPMAGGGDVTKAKLLTHLPIWNFHGGADQVVSPKLSRAMIAAIEAAGGQPQYTEYKQGVRHNCWGWAQKEGQLRPWLFRQNRKRPNVAGVKPNEAIRVAVVGDSISKIRRAYGNRGWPMDLNDLLGDRYDVKTYSTNGVVVLIGPHQNVWGRAELGHAVNFKPHLVVILMGANMGKYGNWVHNKKYVGSYKAVMAQFKNRPKFYICRPIPVHENNFGIRHDLVEGGVTRLVERVAKETGATYVDTYTPMKDLPATTSDGIHPTREGHMLIARAVAAAITGKPDPVIAPRKDGLEIPSILATRMIYQQGKPRPVWGKAMPGVKVTVTFGGKSQTATAGDDRVWRVAFPAAKAGGPYTIVIKTDKDDRPRTMRDVKIGELWLLAGGPDLASIVKRNPGGGEVWQRMGNVRAHIITMPIATSKVPVTRVHATWRLWDRWHSRERSSMGFFFADTLEAKLKVPVGTIISAHGEPVEAWRVPSNASDRAGVYNAMVYPVMGLPLKGVVWIQGGEESREKQAREMFETWKEKWDLGDAEFRYLHVVAGTSRPDLAKLVANNALAKIYGRGDVVAAALPKPGAKPKPAPGAKPGAKPKPRPDAPRKVELTAADVASPKGDGPDGQGNSQDDTWQFWLELGHAPGTYRRLSIATASMPAGQRQKGIPRKVIGPVASKLPNPNDTNGWIFHRDWNGTFEGAWGDKKTGKVLLYPYVEKTFHGAVALTYRAPVDGVYSAVGKLTDEMVRPNYAKHDGFSWRVEKVREGEHGKVLAKGGPVGDGKGRPDAAAFKVEKVSLKTGELLRIVVHPNRWWGTDMTRVELKVERK